MGRGVDLLKLPLNRFLNVLYRASLDRLRYDEKNPDKPRQDFERIMQVAEWQLPGGEYVPAQREEGAPSWWYGDEDASQSFLQSVGVITGG